VLSAQAVVSELKSSFREYAPIAGRFKPSSLATIPEAEVNMHMLPSRSSIDLAAD
jgi:hypothetical protein